MQSEADINLRDVVGVYIREHDIDILVGASLTDDEIIGGENYPKTDNRTLFSVPREDLSPIEMINKSIEVIEKECPKAKSVFVACFGGFESINNEDRANYNRNRKYGVIKGISYDDGWNGLPLYELYKENLAKLENKPIVKVGTDVDTAAYGEYLYLAPDEDKYPNKRKDYFRNYTLAYLSFSRCINGGVVIKGENYSGVIHPNLNSIRPQRFTHTTIGGKALFDYFEGTCQYHNDCIEGLIGSKAIQERTGIADFHDIHRDNPVWEVVAYYIAQMCIFTTAFFAPNKIILSGRVIKHSYDEDFSIELTKRVRGYFYSYIESAGGVFRPDYPDIKKKNDFINLPKKGIKHSGEERVGKPGQHGAIRLAAKESLQWPESNTVTPLTISTTRK